VRQSLDRALNSHTSGAPLFRRLKYPNWLAVQPGGNVLYRLAIKDFVSCVGDKTDMRRRDQPFDLPQRMIDGQRLDLKDVHCKMAVETGVKLTIGTDTHSTAGLGLMAFGVATAARGWATKKDVLNAMTLPQLDKWLSEKRPR